MNFEELKNANKNKINQIKLELKDNNQDLNLKKRLILQTKIDRLLNDDDALFFNITIEEAYKILEQILDDKDLIKDTYTNLTSPHEYERLRREFKI